MIWKHAYEVVCTFTNEKFTWYTNDLFIHYDYSELNVIHNGVTVHVRIIKRLW